MEKKLKWYHWLFALSIIIICGLLVISFGWSAFATLTERPGLNGDAYSYYNLTRLEYSIYTGLVAVAGLYVICSLTYYLAKKEAMNLTKLFWRFLIIFVLIIVCEIYLQTRFVGKG
jgi:formate hydrogenlyase subunit 3/multisubunit Na+/H+ antiporter MnhD subunit